MEGSKSNKRLEEIIQMLGKVAALDFTTKLEVDDSENPLNAIAQGLNWLSEELEANVVERSLYISKNKQLEKALKDLSDYKTALDASAIVAITNSEGEIEYANEAFCQISKYSEGELIGQNQRIVNSGYHPKEFWKEMWATIGKGKVWRNEIRNKDKEGSYYWVDTAIVPFVDKDNQPYKYLSIRRDITKQKNIEQKIVSSIISSQEHDREYFAEDLHEGLAQTLAGLSFQIMAIEGSLGEAENDDLKIGFTSIKQYIHKSMENTRKLAQALMPRTMMQLGLIPSVDHYIQKVNASSDLNVEFKANVQDNEVEKDIEITIYRAVVAIIEKARFFRIAKQISIELTNDSSLNVIINVHGKLNLFSNRRIKMTDTDLVVIQKRIELLGGQMIIDQDSELERTCIQIKFDSSEKKPAIKLAKEKRH